MRLSNLAMDPAARKQAQSQLSALAAKEAVQVVAMRDADNATLRAYKAQLDRETSSGIATQTGAIAAQTRAKLEEHRNDVGAQLHGLAPAPAVQNVSPGVRAQIAGIQKKYAAQFQADAAKTIAQYQATKNDLDRQFAALTVPTSAPPEPRRRSCDRCKNGGTISTAKSSPPSSATQIE